MSRLRRWARALKRQTLVVYFAARDPRAPWFARLLALAVAAYALSPIDLIPDFIPILGYLDDLLILPLGIWLSIRLIPEPVLAHYRQLAKEQLHQRKPNYIMAAVIVVIWLLIGYWMYQAYISQID